MLAILLICLTLMAGFIVYLAQLSRLDSDVEKALRGYAARAQSLGPLATREKIVRLASTTFHPQWTLTVARNDVRYVVHWQPFTVTSEPRNAALLIAPPPFLQRIVAAASTLGLRNPAKVVVNDSEIALFPTGTVQQIAVRTLVVVGIISLIAAFCAFLAAGRLASDAMKPLLALQKAFNAIASGDLTPSYVAESGTDELGSLIGSYNRATDTATKLRLERDAAEARTHQFIADAGHQLRTPLTVLGGFIGILRRGQLRHEDDAPKVLQKMDTQIEIMRKLVERMTVLESWHGPDSPIFQLTDVGEFVTGIVDPIAASRPEVKFRHNTISGLNACIDPAELTYAVSNLVENAMKYAPEGVITVQVRADDKSVYIAIEDEGPGISTDVLPHIFDRFYRGARRDVPGSGLGLAIAKGAVERAHGTLSAQSTLGKGTRFTIALPRVSAASPSYVV